MSAFEELGVMPELIKGIEEMDWLLPTPVQAEAVPLILGGGDVMVAAETGSGKTGAFALPILQVVHETVTARRQERGTSAASSDAPKASSADCTWSMEDRDVVFNVSENGLSCSSMTKGWAGGRATVGATAGRLYFEVTLENDGLCRAGWASRAAAFEIGRDKRSFGFGSTAKKSHGGAFADYGKPFGKGDTVGCLLDLTRNQISYTLNGASMGVAFEVPAQMHGQPLHPAVTLKGAKISTCFGGTRAKFRYGPPAGFTGIADAPNSHLTTAAMEEQGNAAGGVRTPSALILEPSRDLAQQTHDAINSLKRHLTTPALQSVLLVGGTQPKEAARQLERGADIVTGTPGRIMDFVESGKLVLTGVKFFVLDEADRLLDTGNQDTIMKLFGRFPKAGQGVARLQVLMFSATLHSDEVKDIASRICQDPSLVDLKGREAVPDTVDHVLVAVDPKADRSWLQSSPEVPSDNVHALDRTGTSVDTPENWSAAIKRLKPRVLQRLIDAYKMEQCLIFCRTNFDCDNLEKFLNSLGGGRGGRWAGRRESGKENPYSCCVLAGARSTDQRRDALQAFKHGEVRFLICTDVAARGIDISGLPYVINLTLPDRAEDYIHRVGRVGRAEKLGLAISLVSTVREKVWYCSKKGYRPWERPTQKDVETNEQGGHTIWYDEPQLLEDIEARLRQKIASVNPDLSLPKDIAARISAAPGSAAYGQHKGGDTASKDIMEHVEALKPAVAELARLETLAQSFYLKRYAKRKEMTV
ncbi:ATP-dependent RNA helicase DDX1 [Coccomyxa sp. Obi]|nr:ATP-dependent RNA helicase DDX1 [Coccomyxa sp. Obi]